VGRRALPLTPDVQSCGLQPTTVRPARVHARLGHVRARTGRDLRRASLPIFCPGRVASLAVDLLAETRRDRCAALEAGICDRLAGASCHTGHRSRRPRRCSSYEGRCAHQWNNGGPTDLARGLLSNPVMSSPVSALGDRPLISQVAPPNSHRPLAVSGSIFEPCRFVAPLVDSARACGRRPAHCGTQQDADASWPENAGLPRYAVRSMSHHPR
jgi:hypothetical protein